MPGVTKRGGRQARVTEVTVLQAGSVLKLVVLRNHPEWAQWLGHLC